MISGCINDYLGIDGISEVNMTDEQRKNYFLNIMIRLKDEPMDFFNSFLQWFCQEFGDMDISEPCPQCGDTTISYTVEI